MATLEDFYPPSGGGDALAGDYVEKVIKDSENLIEPYNGTNYTHDWVVGPGGDHTGTDLYTAWTAYLAGPGSGLGFTDHVRFLLVDGTSYTCTSAIDSTGTNPTLSVVGPNPDAKNDITITDGFDFLRCSDSGVTKGTPITADGTVTFTVSHDEVNNEATITFTGYDPLGDGIVANDICQIEVPQFVYYNTTINQYQHEDLEPLGWRVKSVSTNTIVVEDWLDVRIPNKYRTGVINWSIDSTQIAQYYVWSCTFYDGTTIRHEPRFENLKFIAETGVTNAKEVFNDNGSRIYYKFLYKNNDSTEYHDNVWYDENGWNWRIEDSNFDATIGGYNGTSQEPYVPPGSVYNRCTFPPDMYSYRMTSFANCTFAGESGGRQSDKYFNCSFKGDDLASYTHRSYDSLTSSFYLKSAMETFMVDIIRATSVTTKGLTFDGGFGQIGGGTGSTVSFPNGTTIQSNNGNVFSTGGAGSTVLSFYTAPSSGASATVLNTVTVRDGFIINWTQV